MKVGIVGLGYVGLGQTKMFGDQVWIGYDVDMSEYPYERFAECDMVVVSVGTPEAEDGRADLSQVEAAIEALPPRVPVALRSTVPPGTTDALLVSRPGLYVHAPEFMGENPLHSWQRPQDVPYMILGGAPTATVYFRNLFTQVFPGEIVTCTAKEAELAKYMANLYWATRVTFVNEMARIAEAMGIDYENARQAWLADPRMTEPYTQVAGYPPGFGGRCWPKDLSALIHAAGEAGYSAEFLGDIQTANEGFH